MSYTIFEISQFILVMFIAYLMARFSDPDDGSKGLFAKIRAMNKQRVDSNTKVEENLYEYFEEEDESF